jgi:tight adherence protein C
MSKRPIRHSSFVILSSFVIRPSTFPEIVTMEPAAVAVLALCWIILLLGGYAVLAKTMVRRRALSRVAEAAGDAGRRAAPAGADDRGMLGRWLFLAGFRDLRAPAAFSVITLLLGAAGIGLAWSAQTTGLTRRALASLSIIPGGVGDIFVPIIYMGPWVMALIVACLPWLVVQRTRRQRVESIEQDLPVTLELLATLSEAGLGFDAALSRVLDSQMRERPLSNELRGLQADVLASRPRIECFRRLARRAQVTSLSVFVSAVVQAEQIGAGVASVLRRQADDLRGRRREDAMALAMALPVKRLFPMVLCFMPGIFVATLGPTFFEFFRFAEMFLRTR